MLSRLERVARHDGIVAVMSWTNEQRHQGAEPTWVGEERWKGLVKECVRLREVAKEQSVRVLVGDHACLVAGDQDKVVAVVFIKGHPIVKSVARMTRRLLKTPSRSRRPREEARSSAESRDLERAPTRSEPHSEAATSPPGSVRLVSGIE